MAKTKRSKLKVLRGQTALKEDRRMFCRFVFNDLPLRFKDLKISIVGRGACKNVSAGGASMVCEYNIEVQTPLEMWFELEDGFEPVRILGRVVWSKMIDGIWHLGVVFTNPKLMKLSRILKMEI